MRDTNGFIRNLGGAAFAILLLLSGGATWAAAGVSTQEGIVGLTYVASTNTLLKASHHALYASGDEGMSWRQIAVPVPKDSQIVSLAASPTAKNGVMYVAGPGVGVLRSEDAGKSWVDRNEGLPTHDVIAIAAHTTEPDTVYAIVQNSGVYRSQDGGKNWRLMDRPLKTGVHQLIHSNMAGSMQTGWLFAATDKGVRRAMDCFCLWQDAGKLGTSARSIAYDPQRPEHILVAADQAIFRSTDGGESWTEVKSPAAHIAALAFAPGSALFATTAEGRLFRSVDAGQTWNQVNA